MFNAGNHYGDGIIKEYSLRLTKELGKGYSKRSLWLMQKFYELNEKMQTVSAYLSYSHYVELLPYDDLNKVKYYIKIAEEQNLSIRKLREKIKSNEYERLDEETRNKLINNEQILVSDFIKEPILINNSYNHTEISEKVLKRLILEDIDNFLSELGNSFCYIKNEYKIKIGESYNYIDLLLFNYEYNCFIVVELKITKLKKEHIGQIEVYMNYIDKNLRKINQDKTIGIIICKENNEYVIKYSSDSRIISRKYEVI